MRVGETINSIIWHASQPLPMNSRRAAKLLLGSSKYQSHMGIRVATRAAALSAALAKNHRADKPPAQAASQRRHGDDEVSVRRANLPTDRQFRRVAPAQFTLSLMVSSSGKHFATIGVAW